MIRAPGLAARLGLGFGLILAMVMGQVALTLVQERRVAALEARLAGEVAPRGEAAHRLEQAFFRRVVAFRAYLMRRDDRYRLDFESAGAEGEAALERLHDLGGADRFLEEIEPTLSSFDETAGRILTRLMEGAPEEEVTRLDHDLVEVRNHLTKVLGELVRQGDLDSARRFAELRRTQAWASRMSVGLGLAVILAGAVAAAWVIRPVRRQAGILVEASRALAAGDHGPARALQGGDARPSMDELELVARSFGAMSVQLEARERRLEDGARLARILASVHDVEPLASRALAALVEAAGCESGAIYLFDRDRTRLSRVASFAADGAALELAAGEGLPGQAAAAERPVFARHLPADGPFRLRLGVADLPARTVAALPIGNEQVMGTLVLASVRDRSDADFAFAADSCPLLAVSLENALAAAEVARLAGALRETNEALEDRNAELSAQAGEIQAQNEELQAQAEEIVAQNEELHRQQEELLAADGMKDEFLSVASHEFKSPIAALKSFCQLALRKARGRLEYAELVPTLERIDAQADKVVTRINRLLDVSRAKMGTLTASPERLDLVALVRGLVSQAQVRSERHHLVLESSVEHLQGRWDRLFLEQAIGNLLDNAIRYSPAGGEIDVKIEDAGGEARVSVRDGGIGMAPETQARLFQPYFRDEAARRVAADGMGIGLFVTKEIVALHGGRISVESRPGEGSTFRVELPLAPPAAA